MNTIAGSCVFGCAASIAFFALGGCMSEEDLEGVGGDVVSDELTQELREGLEPNLAETAWTARLDEGDDGLDIASPPGDGPFRLIAGSSPPSSPKCVDVINGSTQNGARVQQWDCNAFDQQSWYLEQINSPSIPRQVWPRHAQVPQKCLDVLDRQTGNGAPLQQWDCNGFSQQKWIFDALYYVGAPWDSWVYRLRPSHAQSMCLDVSGASPNNGARLQIYACHGGANQQFMLRNF